jgi:hypothetical protein
VHDLEIDVATNSGKLPVTKKRRIILGGLLIISYGPYYCSCGLISRNHINLSYTAFLFTYRLRHFVLGTFGSLERYVAWDVFNLEHFAVGPFCGLEHFVVGTFCTLGCFLTWNIL